MLKIDSESKKLVELDQSNLVAENLLERYDLQEMIVNSWDNVRKRYGLNISAFAVEIHKLQGESFLSFRQRYPLKELSDIYETRHSKRKRTTDSDKTWDDIIPLLTYPFGKKGISLCLKHREGLPKRRRFNNIRKNYDGFKWITISC